MPEVNHTTPLPGLKYELVSWGEIITGTKEQLQALGIGVGSAFPGEPGGAKRKITVRDPRGLPTRISLERWARGYTAYISFPGLECLKDQPIDFAPGVQKSGGRGTPTYKGTGEALVAAGLVLAHQLPGPTGVRKQCVRIRPDGSIVLGGRSMTFEDRQLTTQPGAKWIERDGKETYKVTVFVETSEEEDRQNLEAYHRAVSEYEAWAWSQPRPAPLIDPALCESRAPRMLPSRVKTRSPLQKIRTEGNVIYLGAPRPRGTTAL